MLNPRQQAKLAVLKNLQKSMHSMMGEKLKKSKAPKPVAAHVEMDMVPKHPVDGVSPEEMLAQMHGEGAGSEGSPEAELAEKRHGLAASDPAEDADMELLRKHYGSLA